MSAPVKPTWNSQLLGALSSAVKYEGSRDLNSWKHVRNSFKFLMETFTLSKASSTLVSQEKVKMFKIFNNVPQSEILRLGLERFLPCQLTSYKLPTVY